MGSSNGSARVLGLLKPSCVIALAVSFIACASGHRSPPVAAAPRKPSTPASGPTATSPRVAPTRPAPPSAVSARSVRIRITQSGQIRTLPLDQYVAGAVRAEVPPRWLNSEAVGRLLRVQALVSRTYAVANLERHRQEGFNLCDTTHCQLYRELGSAAADDQARRAVRDTQGQIITFKNRPIQALFHSNCGGHTAAAETVWGGQTEPYLQAVDDTFCRQLNTGGWIFSVDQPRLVRAVNSDPRTRVGQVKAVGIVARDEAGRATQISIVGSARTAIVRSEEFRSVLRTIFGAHSLRSTQFDVQRRGDRFVFEGVGYGHGVGLCQTGAAARAQSGHAPDDILSHYFPGTEIRSIH